MTPGTPSIPIALVSPGWPVGAFPNGIVTYTSQLAPALGRAGASAHVVALEVERGAAGAGISDLTGFVEARGLVQRAMMGICERLAPGRWAAVRASRAIAGVVRRLARESGVALVEMEESFGWAGRVARQVDVPVVVRLHGPWFLVGPLQGGLSEAASRRRVRAEGDALRRAAGVVSPSRSVLEETRRFYGLPLENAEVIPCPIAPAAPGQRWSRQGARPGSVLFVGRFDKVKGGDTIIRSFAEVHRQNPGASLTFAGPDRGVADQAGRRWTLPEYIAAHVPDPAARAAIRFLDEQRPEAIPALRRRAAATVVCSRYETFGYALCEAMAQGCPIVATAAGGLAEQIEDGRNGLLVPPDDPGALAAATVRLLREPDLAERLGQQAAQDCSARYAPDVIAARTLAFYRRVLAARSRGAAPAAEPRPAARRVRA